MLFDFGTVDTVAGDSMHVERHVEFAFLAGGKVAVDVFENCLVGMFVIEIDYPKPVVGWNSDVVEPVLGEEIECFEVWFFGFGSWFPIDEPLEVEAFEFGVVHGFGFSFL